jgi:hydrogenase maturation protein HypF
LALAPRFAPWNRVRRRLEVHGIVQGVGFRPWVYQLAQRYRLCGYVLNSTAGVTVEVEGPAESLDQFEFELRSHPPPLAQIDDIQSTELAPAGYTDFRILESRGAADEFVLVPPDIATCPDCLREMHDPADRRYRYPFTNCTNCGPRYSIIRDIPYDRPNTTMAEFKQCPACLREYRDPADRRFHAEPNACPACGPSVELRDQQTTLSVGTAAIEEARALMASGAILGIKGLGGFHLACDATNHAAVERLRERKRRSAKPFALMSPSPEAIRSFAHVDDAESLALCSVRRPVVLLSRHPESRISAGAAPGNATLGVMLPYTPLHHLLLEGDHFEALVMTSGNLSEEPIAYRNEDVPTRLESLADYFLIHNRKIHTRVDDSVVRVFEGRERLIRRSRGYAPHPLDLGVPVEQILACGGELKNTFCLTKDHYAILSQHIGDMENLETLEFFHEVLEHMRRFFRVEPRVVAYDLHPQYLTTRLALSMQGVELVGVQHHHAHIAACMAENGLHGKVIGVALDGTGYGTDGKIWGGEFLLCDFVGFERRAHFRYVPLAGGDAGIRQPWRMALSYLRDAGVDAPLEGIKASQRRVVESMIERRINCVDTSSCGRLFDAVSAILGIRLETTYEGQAAIELEATALPEVADGYPFALADDTVDFRDAIRALVTDREAPSLAAARFHNTVVEAVAAVCERLRSESSRVCLSGGTFQNWYLLRRTVDRLRALGFEVFVHAKVPPNDGGLCLGQAMVANAAVTGSVK